MYKNILSVQDLINRTARIDHYYIGGAICRREYYYIRQYIDPYARYVVAKRPADIVINYVYQNCARTLSYTYTPGIPGVSRPYYLSIDLVAAILFLNNYSIASLQPRRKRTLLPSTREDIPLALPNPPPFPLPSHSPKKRTLTSLFSPAVPHHAAKSLTLGQITHPYSRRVTACNNAVKMGDENCSTRVSVS